MDKRLLIPTDFSPVANQALVYGLHLADRISAEIVVLHVFDHLLLETDILPFHIDQALAMREFPIAQEQTQKHVETLMRKEGLDIPFEAIVAEGFPKEQILRVLEDQKIDMTVMGTTGATNRLETLFGSTTSAIMAKSAVPVLAIPPDCDFEDLRKMAFAMDYKEENNRNFYEVSRMAKLLGAEVECVHIETARKTEEELAEAELIHAPAMEFGQIPFHLVSGKSVSNGLKAFIDSEDIQLLAVIPREHKFPQSLWEKSISRDMVLNANIPILAVSTHF